MKTRVVPATTVGTMEPPPQKKRCDGLRGDVLRKKKEVKKEGYCENCKERYDDYDDVRSHNPP